LASGWQGQVRRAAAALLRSVVQEEDAPAGVDERRAERRREMRLAGSAGAK
jgi:hypothetical protein